MNDPNIRFDKTKKKQEFPVTVTLSHHLNSNNSPTSKKERKNENKNLKYQ